MAPRFQTMSEGSSFPLKCRFVLSGIDRVWPSFANMLDIKSQVDLSSNLGHRVLVAELSLELEE